MSFSFVVCQINTSIERLANWYREFMQRTEQAFRSLNERTLRLEARQAWVGPSDEQVERVLQKVLAERFADPGPQSFHNPNIMKDGESFVEPLGKASPVIPYSIPIDLSSLHVDPSAMPSPAYAETLEMLEGKLPNFPNIDLSKSAQAEGYSEAQDVKVSLEELKRPKLPPIKHQHDRLWS